MSLMEFGKAELSLSILLHVSLFIGPQKGELRSKTWRGEEKSIKRYVHDHPRVRDETKRERSSEREERKRKDVNVLILIPQ